jgi:hypothetical protein
VLEIPFCNVLLALQSSRSGGLGAELASRAIQAMSSRPGALTVSSSYRGFEAFEQTGQFLLKDINHLQKNSAVTLEFSKQPSWLKSRASFLDSWTLGTGWRGRSTADKPSQALLQASSFRDVLAGNDDPGIGACPSASGPSDAALHRATQDWGVFNGENRALAQQNGVHTSHEAASVLGTHVQSTGTYRCEKHPLAQILKCWLALTWFSPSLAKARYHASAIKQTKLLHERVRDTAKA